MNCYKHPEVAAVSTCSQGCGRSLCPGCAGIYNPPTCEICASTIEQENRAEIALEKSTVIKRMVINGIFFCAYILAFFIMQGNPSKQSGSVLLIFIPLMIWGFFGFKWLMQSFHRVTGLVIFDTLQGFCVKYLTGSIVTSMTGLIVIPFILLMQWRQLRKIKTIEKKIL